jgi:hypothetical protein
MIIVSLINQGIICSFVQALPKLEIGDKSLERASRLEHCYPHILAFSRFRLGSLFVKFEESRLQQNQGCFS